MMYGIAQTQNKYKAGATGQGKVDEQNDLGPGWCINRTYPCKAA